MNILLSETSASCIVKCPWEIPDERKDKYARIRVLGGSGKRPFGKPRRGETSCVVEATVWGSSHPRSSVTAKAFRKESSSECVIAGWNAPARLLSVDSAVDTSLYMQFTWVLVAVSRRNGAHGLALLRFGREGIELEQVFQANESPEQGVVLRGPVALYCTSSDIALVGDQELVTLDSVLEERLGSASPKRFICRAGRDVEAHVASLDQPTTVSKHLTIRTIHISGSAGTAWRAIDVKGSSIKVVAVSAGKGILALAEADGTIKAVDINSGNLLWQTMPTKSLENPISLTFYREVLLVTSKNSEAIWSVPVYAGDRNATQRNVALLFGEECVTVGSEGHGHFFAPWRGSLLQCSDENGTHCLEKDINFDGRSTTTLGPHDAPFMLAVSKNLERRLDLGVQRLTDVAQRKEEKTSILNHVRSLLMEASGKKVRIAYPKLFDGHMESVLMLPERRKAISEVYPPEEERLSIEHPLLSARVVVGGQSPLAGLTRFVRLLKCVSGVDRSSRFIIVRVHVSLLQLARMDNDRPSPTMTIQLNVQFDRCMSAIWDVEKKSDLCEGNVVWLRACAPISAVVSNNIGGFTDLSVIVRVDADDGRSQHLGTFALSSLLSSVVNVDAPAVKGGAGELMNFEKQIHAIAQGTSAHRLQYLPQRRAISDEFTINTRENLACVSFKVTSKIELALAIAKLRACIDDDVRLRSSAELRKQSLSNVDSSLRALEGEMHWVRNIATQRGVVGYNVAQILELLECQMKVDDSFGCIEEQFIGT